MKMVRAIVRPESTENVVEGLAASGFVALTKIQAFGRGKQKGLDSGSVHYDELPKNLLMQILCGEEPDIESPENRCYWVDAVMVWRQGRS